MEARFCSCQQLQPISPKPVPKHPQVIGNRRFRLLRGRNTMSFGLLLSNAWGVRPVGRITLQVDAALYAAKAGGRN